ncbi:hypothetical protein [Nocardia sp. XZ_19_369]|uniref:hypothetical protein n=1 Tax=Nocardia sp. XZ_19_369 TaxID=2769487 RepID=UPI0018905FBF|nr:hypothetical protein [Nocardia sp. XZ_19_369]
MSTSTKRRPVIITVAVAAAMISCVLLIQCETNPTSTSSSTDSHAHIDPLDPVGASPEAVAINAITIIHSWRPSHDNAPWQALHRATALLTHPIVQAASTPPNPPPRPIPEWDGWARSRDQLSAAVTILEPATLTGATATVPVRLAQIVLHPDGLTTPWRTTTLRVELARDGDIWRVGSYTTVAVSR